MKNHPLSKFVFLFLFLVSCRGGPASAADIDPGGSSGKEPSLSGAIARSRAPFAWLENLDEARRLAAEANKPLLIVFRCEP